MNGKLVVCCTPFGADWRWIVEDVAAPGVEFKYFSDKAKYFWQHYLQRPNLNTPVAGLRTALYVWRRRADLLISVDPRLSFWCALFCRLFGVRVKHLASSFNFAELPQGRKLRLFRYAFQQLADLRVHSQMEKTLYSECFGIPESRIEVRLWSMNTPEVSPEPPVMAGPYISAVGGNARDYQTLLEAARLLPEVPMVWVVRPQNIAGLDLPPQVRVLSNIPYPKAMNVVQHSRLTVVPLKGSQVPCGHVTLVSGMLLKKAIVATRSAGISDYVTDGWNGLLCEPQSAGDLAEKIRRLWDDPEDAERMGANGLRFAKEHCTEQSVRDDLLAYLQGCGLAADKAELVKE